MCNKHRTVYPAGPGQVMINPVQGKQQCTHKCPHVHMYTHTVMLLYVHVHTYCLLHCLHYTACMYRLDSQRVHCTCTCTYEHVTFMACLPFIIGVSPFTCTCSNLLALSWGGGSIRTVKNYDYEVSFMWSI